MKKIRIGIFGAGRGADVATNFMLLGCEIVALCDNRPDRTQEALRRLGTDVATYDNFDDFIEHEMDAVIIANFFHEHAPYAIKCFERGIHVFSECISNGTMAEGVEMIRAFEKSKSIYMLAENYPMMLFNREIKRICDGGTLGRLLYAEGEYNHPFNLKEAHFKKRNYYFEGHWRNYLPRAAYVTHALAPLMYATGATPKRVSAYALYAPFDPDLPTGTNVGDRAAILVTQNDDGSLFRFTGCAAFGSHHNAYRVCGTKGQIENLRGMSPQVMLRYNDWEIPEGSKKDNLYVPEWNDKDEEFIKKSGHGGGDYLTARLFVECITNGTQPPRPFDLHSAVTMSSVSILGHRSTLENGASYEIPDFTKEEWRVRYENDRLSPFPAKEGEKPTLPCCSHPDYKPTQEQVELYRKQLEQ